jgi:hypothetical protein
MYEHLRQPPIPRARFLRRLGAHVAIGLAFLAVSLLIGMMGYRGFEHLPWVDAFLNAAMLMGGMGPVDTPHSSGGKLFAGIYALYAGLGVIVTAGLMFTPVLHRLMHRFHWEDRS